ncbi:hypothetical protein ABK040_009764 [Willaertia magna]
MKLALILCLFVFTILQIKGETLFAVKDQITGTQLLTVNPVTGNTTQVGTPIKDLRPLDTLTYDLNNGMLYFVAYTNSLKLFLISLRLDGSLHASPIPLNVDIVYNCFVNPKDGNVLLYAGLINEGESVFTIINVDIKKGTLKQIASYGKSKNSNIGISAFNYKENYVFTEAIDSFSNPNQTLSFIIDLNSGNVKQGIVKRKYGLEGKFVFDPKLNNLVGVGFIDHQDPFIVSCDPILNEEKQIVRLDSKFHSFVIGSTINYETSHIFCVLNRGFVGPTLLTVDYSNGQILSAASIGRLESILIVP